MSRPESSYRAVLRNLWRADRKQERDVGLPRRGHASRWPTYARLGAEARSRSISATEVIAKGRRRQ